VVNLRLLSPSVYPGQEALELQSLTSARVGSSSGFRCDAASPELLNQSVLFEDFPTSSRACTLGEAEDAIGTG